jgi:long-chain fatty acid transport protein
MGLSATYWNPAAITQATGWWSESHLALVMPNSDLNALPGTGPALLALGADADNVGKSGVIPAAYAAHRLTPDLVIGYSLNAPFALATRTAIPWAGQTLGTRGEVKSIDFAPLVGWRVNDWLSIGGGPRVLWLQGKFSRSLLPSAALPFVSNLDVDDVGFGFTLGATITPSPWTEVSLGYRSQVHLTLEGDVNFPAIPPALLGPLGFVSGAEFNIGGGKVKTPDLGTLGVRHRVNERFTLLGTVEWSNWSNVQAVPFFFTNGPAPGLNITTLTFNYRDGWFFSVGGEYQITPQHTLRAGIGYEISPVRDEVRDPILPDNDRWWFSAGMSSKVFEWMTLDVGYSFIWVGDTPINVGPAHPDFALLLGAGPLIASGDPYIHIVAASLRFKWTDFARPIATKG